MWETFSPVKVGFLKEVGIVMSAKEKAIEVCGAVPIARHINDDRFSVGWYTDRLYETGVGSKVDDEGLFFWADTGYGDCDHPVGSGRTGLTPRVSCTLFMRNWRQS